MPEFIDTHAHIYLSEFDEDIDAVMNRALERGVTHVLMPNIDSSTIDAMLALEKKFPSVCRSMIGLHPCSVNENFERELGKIEKSLAGGNFLAIGEIGTDLYWDKSFWEQQKIAFSEQVNLANKVDLPVAIHCRESIDETIELLEKMPISTHKGVFHCFTGTERQGRRIVEMGYYLGIGGVSTFKSSTLREVLSFFSLENLLLETDSPYLAPVPHRGKRNEPSYLPSVAANLSTIYGCSADEVGEITSRNAKKLFSL